MPNDFILFYTGSSIDILALRSALENKNIQAIVKDNSESARLAGFGTPTPMLQQVFVHRDEIELAKNILAEVF